MCNQDFEDRKQLLNHFYHVHQIEINHKTFTFDTIEEFNNWKSTIEKESYTKFIKHRGSASKNTLQNTYYCHRSGFFASKSTGIRHLKTQGSCKINGYCPAELSVRHDIDVNKYIVNFIDTHVGHQNDIGHMRLSDEEKKTIASKIAAKIPLPEILNEIRESTLNTDFNRVHLLTNKDLNNIIQKYNLQSDAVRHKNDLISVKSWVQEMKDKTNSILYFKNQGNVDEEHDLKEENFVLIIMTKGQEHMLQKYSNYCICVDGTHGLNNYNFELHSLVILDSLRQGFPAAFCITNRSVFRLFFDKIKERIGLIAPKVFMSDMAEGYYNAWLQVMPAPKFRLYCTWHVDRAWYKNLSLINSQEKKVIIYKQLRALLQETDKNALNIMIHQFIEVNLEDPETSKFVAYFRNNYSEKVAYWAYYYRLYCELNTNMHIENIHRLIKHIYLNGKKVQRLDKAIHALMKMIRDKLFDQMIILNKGKVSSKISNLRQRHKASENLNLNILKRQYLVWDISSETKPFMYTIEKIEIGCDCLLRCEECKICIHEYVCSCIDSAIQFNMCKHIHYLCKINYANSQQPRLANSELSSSENNSTESLKNRKEIFKLKISKMLNDIQNIEEMAALENLVNPFDAMLLAIRSNKQIVTKDTVHKIPSNKKISPQRKIFSTKKSKKATKI